LFFQAWFVQAARHYGNFWVPRKRLIFEEPPEFTYEKENLLGSHKRVVPHLEHESNSDMEGGTAFGSDSETTIGSDVEIGTTIGGPGERKKKQKSPGW